MANEVGGSGEIDNLNCGAHGLVGEVTR